MATGVLKLKLSPTLLGSQIYLNGVDLSKWIVSCSIYASSREVTTVELELVPEWIELPKEIEAVIKVYRESSEWRKETLVEEE